MKTLGMNRQRNVMLFFAGARRRGRKACRWPFAAAAVKAACWRRRYDVWRGAHRYIMARVARHRAQQRCLYGARRWPGAHRHRERDGGPRRIPKALRVRVNLSKMASACIGGSRPCWHRGPGIVARAGTFSQETNRPAPLNMAIILISNIIFKHRQIIKPHIYRAAAF